MRRRVRRRPRHDFPVPLLPRLLGRDPGRPRTRHRAPRIHAFPMNAPTPPSAPAETADGFRINALTGAAIAPARTLSAPLSAEIAAAFAASSGGEIAVRSVDVNIPLLEKNDILAERNRG